MKEKVNTKKFSRGKKIKFILFTLTFLMVIIIIISEILLYFMHFETIYSRMQGFSLAKANWWTCDSVNGPRYVKNQLGKDDSVYFKNEIWYYNRLKIVNNEGYHDRDNFIETNPKSDSLKVLIAGDSFTWGASADVDSSYVDVFERDLKKFYPSVVWNTGIPATGTNHAIFTVKKFLPLQKSNYVILGFYVGNDFGDNLLPFDQLVFNNLASCYNLYDYNNDLRPYKVAKREAYKKATGSYPIEELNMASKLLIRSRLFSYISEIKDKVINRLSGRKNKANIQEYIRTKEYLKELDTYSKENNAELIVLVIPSWDDLKNKGIHYLNAIKILNELSIKYVQNIEQFSEKDYMKSGGGHWINSGHIKAGQSLSKYLLNYIDEKKQKTFKKDY